MKILLFGRPKSNLPTSILKANNISVYCKYIVLLPFLYKNVTLGNPQMQNYCTEI